MTGSTRTDTRPPAGKDADRQPVILSEERVAKLLAPGLVLRIVEQTLAALSDGRAFQGSKGSMHLHDADGLRTFHAMTGVLHQEQVAGVKWVATVAENGKRGLPRAPATILLSDSTTGRLLAVVEATAITAWRTAAAAAVTAKYCAVAKPVAAAILGFGAIGKALVPMLTTLFEIERIGVWGGREDRLRREAEGLAVEHAVSITVAQNPHDAVAGADIVFTATGLSEDRPFLFRPMLGGKTFVCGLGSYQEIGDDIIASSDMLIVDDWDACSRRGNFAPAIRAGRLTQASVYAGLADLVAGKRPRRPPHTELSLACLPGLGVLDVAIAFDLLGRARAA